MKMVSEEEAQAAVDYLRDSAESTAVAKANVTYTEGWLKVVKANAMAASNQKSAAAQERVALASAEYAEALEALREAVYKAQKAMFLREAASAKLEMYRTQSANYRGIKI